MSSDRPLAARFVPRGPARGCFGAVGGATVTSPRWQRGQLGPILTDYSLLEDTGVPAYRCFSSEYYRDPEHCDGSQ